MALAHRAWGESEVLRRMMLHQRMPSKKEKRGRAIFL